MSYVACHKSHGRHDLWRSGSDLAQAGVGNTIDGGTHWVRALRLWMGEIARVVAVNERPLATMAGESLTHAIVKFESGKTATFDCLVMDAPMSKAEPFFRIQGTKGEIELGLHAQGSSTSSIDCMRGSQRITGPGGEESLIIIISSPQTYPSRRLEPVRPTLVRLMKRVWRPWISARGGDTRLLSSLFKALWLTCETFGSTSGTGALDAAGADNSAVGAIAASGALGTAAFFAARAFASRLCFWSRSELGLTFSLSSATRLVVRQRRCDSL